VVIVKPIELIQEGENMPKQSYDEANHGRGRPTRKHSGGIADWAQLDADRFMKLVEQLSNWGCAIRLGKTRDGGAYAVGIYGVDKEPYTEFLPPSESPVDLLQELADYMEGQPGALKSAGRIK